MVPPFKTRWNFTEGSGLTAKDTTGTLSGTISEADWTDFYDDASVGPHIRGRDRGWLGTSWHNEHPGHDKERLD